MALLGAVNYDPATAATASTASLLAMTAFDTTNCRITFTAPSNGNVFVRIRCTQKGATTNPMILLGVLDGATVKGRQASASGRTPGSSTLACREACFLVTGLTPGQSYTWDAAYGVETLVAATQIGWGGPNNTTANDAYGAITFEVWDAPNLLAGTMYDPATAVSLAVATTAAITALDTTNLRLTFTAPGTGNVLAKIRTVISGTSSGGTYMLGILDGAAIKIRQGPMNSWTNSGTLAVTDWNVIELLGVVTGLTAGQSYTWDAAYGVETAVASATLKYGGPDNAVANDAWGGIAYEIWEI